MSGYRACSQCQGLMVLEDQGEMLEALDVMSLFEYRCRACGHLERSEKGSVQMETKVLPEDQDPIQHRWSELDPALRVDLPKAIRENRCKRKRLLLNEPLVVSRIGEDQIDHAEHAGGRGHLDG